nr:hypothetical protein [Tanacetum cinerariifolium]
RRRSRNSRCAGTYRPLSGGPQSGASGTDPGRPRQHHGHRRESLLKTHAMDILIPGFDIGGEIGEGAMATVYLATQRSLERKVALKIMAATLAADPTFWPGLRAPDRLCAGLCPCARAGPPRCKTGQHSVPRQRLGRALGLWYRQIAG